MRKIVVGFALTAMLFALCSSAQAQQPKKIPRIGYLTAGRAPSSMPSRSFTEGFRQGLRELGYIEGKNIIIEYRWGEGKFDQMPKLAGELVALGVNIIGTSGMPAV